MSNREFYDEIAPRYDALRYRTPYQRRTAEMELGYLAPLLPRGRYLELGPGTGRVTRMLLERADSVQAVDVSAGMLDQLRGHFPGEDRLRTTVLDVDRLESLEGYGAFDCCVSMRVLPHLPDLPRVLRLLRGAVRPRGTVAFDLWNAWGYDAVAKRVGLRRTRVYTRYHTIAEMRRMIADAGLAVVSMRGFGYPPFRALLALDRSGHALVGRFAQRVLWVCTPAGGREP
jgi:SAM-dependent methyltransferase